VRFRGVPLKGVLNRTLGVFDVFCLALTKNLRRAKVSSYYKFAETLKNAQMLTFFLVFQGNIRILIARIIACAELLA